MQVTLCVVPPGGGEADNEFSVDVEAVPRVGEYVWIGDGKGGVDAFKVLYVTHFFDSNDNGDIRRRSIVAQMEPVRFLGQMDQSGSAHYGYYFERMKGSDLIQNYPASGY